MHKIWLNRSGFTVKSKDIVSVTREPVMSWIDEEGVGIEDPSMSVIEYDHHGDLHKSLVVHLSQMGWTFRQIGSFFGRTEDWARKLYPPDERPEKTWVEKREESIKLGRATKKRKRQVDSDPPQRQKP